MIPAPAEERDGGRDGNLWLVPNWALPADANDSDPTTEDILRSGMMEYLRRSPPYLVIPVILQHLPSKANMRKNAAQYEDVNPRLHGNDRVCSISCIEDLLSGLLVPYIIACRNRGEWRPACS